MDRKYLAFGRRQIAVHEAGHAIVARHFLGSGEIQARIWRSDRGWEGRCRTPKRKEMDDPRTERIFGLAGGVAVMILHKIPPKSIWKASYLFSNGDWRSIGYVNRNGSHVSMPGSDPGGMYEAIDFTERLLKRDWKSVLATARQIVINSRSTDEFRKVA